jgi:hypothetical protein
MGNRLDTRARSAAWQMAALPRASLGSGAGNHHFWLISLIGIKRSDFPTPILPQVDEAISKSGFYK